MNIIRRSEVFVLEEKTINEDETIISDGESKEEKKANKKEKKEKKKDELTTLKEENAALKDQLLRFRAEVENFKKRVNEERIRDRQYASQTLVTDLIMVLDNLDRACNFESDNQELNNFLIGFKMINEQIFDILGNDGLKPIKALNEKFDPNLHQSVAQECVEDKEDGIVLEVMQKGYTYKDRVIKPSMVKINSKENK